MKTKNPDIDTSPYYIAIQNTVDKKELPSEQALQSWALAVLQDRLKRAELCIRIVSKEESAELNEQYRQKPQATNVLAFPAEIPEDIDLQRPLLGDIIICADVVVKEAKTQGKTIDAHFAHLLIHGILHLLGFDHQNEPDALEMEKTEINILNQLGYANPYAI